MRLKSDYWQIFINLYLLEEIMFGASLEEVKELISDAETRISALVKDIKEQMPACVCMAGQRADADVRDNQAVAMPPELIPIILDEDVSRASQITVCAQDIVAMFGLGKNGTAILVTEAFDFITDRDLDMLFTRSPLARMEECIPNPIHATTFQHRRATNLLGGDPSWASLKMPDGRDCAHLGTDGRVRLNTEKIAQVSRRGDDTVVTFKNNCHDAITLVTPYSTMVTRWNGEDEEDGA